MVSLNSTSPVERQLMSTGLFSLVSGLMGTKIYLELRRGTFAIGKWRVLSGSEPLLRVAQKCAVLTVVGSLLLR